MTIYKLVISFESKSPSAVLKTANRLVYGIPFDPANTDYQTFKSDIESGAELQDADGNVMSADEAKAFIATLP